MPFQQVQKDVSNTGAFTRLHWYAAVWALSVFVFFTVADTKLLTYILPMFPALALWLAGTFEQGLHNRAFNATLQKTAWGLCVLVIIAFGVLMVLAKRFPVDIAAIVNSPQSLLAAGALLTGVLAFSLLLQKNKTTSALLVMGVTFSVLSAVAFGTIVPRVNRLTQGDLMANIALADKRPLGTYEITKPSLTYYTDRHIPQIRHDETARDTLKAFLQAGCASGTSSGNPSCYPVYIITKHRFVAGLKQNLPKGAIVRVVRQDKIFSLLAVQGISP